MTAESSRGSVAYLVNQYPAPSHTFIRREILALEALGWQVYRFSHRRSAGELVDPADRAELVRTTVLLDGWQRLLVAVLASLMRHPIATLSTLALALRMARSSERGMLTHIGYFALACLLTRHLKTLGVDQLHVHFSLNPADVACLCNELAGTKFSATFHASYEYDHTASGLNLREKVARAERVVMISEHGVNTLARAFPEHADKITLVRCGLDEHWFEAKPRPPSGCGHFVSVARLAEQKQPHLLLEALARARKQGIELSLTMVGDGPMRERVEQIVDELKLTDAVILAGWCDQEMIERELLKARALALSSLSEGIPVAIMEAFAHGRPAIATDVGGVSELVESGRTGWLVPPGDVDAYTDAVIACATCEVDELKRLGDEAWQRVQAYNIKNSAHAMDALLSDIKGGAYAFAS